MPIFLLKYWFHILVAFGSIAGGFFVHKHIYDSGYKDAETIYLAKIAEYETKVDKKIIDIQNSANSISIAIERNHEVVSNNISNIAKGLKGKQLFITTNGKCTISNDFKGAIDKIVEEANKKAVVK